MQSGSTGSFRSSKPSAPVLRCHPSILCFCRNVSSLSEASGVHIKVPRTGISIVPWLVACDTPHMRYSKFGTTRLTSLRTSSSTGRISNDKIRMVVFHISE